MSFKIKFCFLGLFALLFSACGNDASKHHMALNEANGFDSIYDTNASTLKSTSAADPQGQKKLILYFFSSMCDGCEMMAPILSQINKENANTIAYGIMTDSTGFDRDLDIMRVKKVDFISTSTPKSATYFSQLIGGITGTPTIVVYDAQGKRKKTFVGIVSKDDILKALE